ncbi:MAG: RNA ligase [Aureispira sp.]|nr:RNA ligase [Aureispira sp.]
MQHISYQKIRESSKKWQLDIQQHQLLEKLQWVVTEKIHGANFSILVDKDQVQFAKRKEMLEDDEDFFGHSLLKEVLIKKAKELFLLLNSKSQNIEQINIYGELFGGAYPHPNVSVNTQVEAVQTGIYYSPNIEFSVFDIGFITTEEEELSFLDYTLLTEYCEEVGFLYCPSLLIGDYASSVNYPFRFQSTIPELLGLPKLSDNLAEGIVVKPVENIWLETPKGRIRPILKFKIPEFSEDARFQQAQKWTASSRSPSKEALVVNNLFLEQQVLPLITKQRLNNAISKIGRLTKRTKNRVLELLKEDIYEELVESLNTDLEEHQATILEYIHADCNNIVKKAL